MTKKRQLKRINMKDSAVSKIVIVDKTKSSRGYIEDLNMNNTIQPSIVRLEDEDAWNLYQGNEWVFSTVQRIVKDCVKATPEVVPVDKTIKMSGRLKQRIKEVQNFLENPNNNKESFAEIREKSILNMLIYGRSTIEKVLNPETRELQEIYALSPKNIKIKADIHGNLPAQDAYIMEPKINRTNRINQDNGNKSLRDTNCPC